MYVVQLRKVLSLVPQRHYCCKRNIAGITGFSIETVDLLVVVIVPFGCSYCTFRHVMYAKYVMISRRYYRESYDSEEWHLLGCYTVWLL
jgi:hypothetical protein